MRRPSRYSLSSSNRAKAQFAEVRAELSKADERGPASFTKSHMCPVQRRAGDLSRQRVGTFPFNSHFLLTPNA
jgi:hypothetical protein